jgi:hypothetical protein
MIIRAGVSHKLHLTDVFRQGRSDIGQNVRNFVVGLHALERRPCDLVAKRAISHAAKGGNAPASARAFGTSSITTPFAKGSISFVWSAITDILPMRLLTFLTFTPSCADASMSNVTNAVVTQTASTTARSMCHLQSQTQFLYI